MIYAVIGVLFITEFVLSGSMSCTKLTAACPTAAEWPDRSNSFNCPGYKRYVCLIAPKAELREGCIFDSFIPAGRVGCPYTDQCANRTGTPLLVMEQNYLSCPPDLYGCPSYNHSGYSILEIYKYPMCQGRSIPEERYMNMEKWNLTLSSFLSLFFSSLSSIEEYPSCCLGSSSVPNITTETVTAIPPARIPTDGNLTRNIICIILGVIVTSTTITIVIFRKKFEGRLKYWGDRQHSRDAVNGKSNANSPVNDGIYYKNDGAFSIHSSKGNSKDFQNDYVANTEDIHLTTRIVPSVQVDGVPSEPSPNNYRQEETELPLCVQHSYPTKQETISLDVTIKNEPQDNMDESILSKGSTVSRPVSERSCSSNDSVTSNDPMLKKASKNLKLKSLRKWNSSSQTSQEECPNPAVTNSAEGNTRTHISEGNSVCNKVLNTTNREKALRIVRRMKEKSEKAETCSTKTTTEYVKVLEKALQEYHQKKTKI